MRPITVFHTLLLSTTLLALPACVTLGGPGPGVAYVRYGPPAPVVEVVAVRPGPGYVWIPGYHAWRGGNYVWISGRYELPARGFTRYEPGRWRNTRSGWFWVEGRWR